MHGVRVAATSAAAAVSILSSFLLPLFATGATAQTSSVPTTTTTDADTCPDDDVCLTAFRFCRGEGDDAQCNFPDDEPIQQQDAGTVNSFFVIFAEEEYNITWKNMKEGHGPVWIQWRFQDPNGNSSVKWRSSTNEDHYIFRPESVFLDFPNELANISYSEAVVGATTSNTIIITQQNSIEEVANAAGSQSDSFSVLNNVALKTVNALRNARDGNKKEELRNWRIGVGVGVGVGVPLLMGLAFFAGKRQGRSKSIRSGSSY